MKLETHYIRASIITSILVLLPIVFVGILFFSGNSEDFDSGASQGFGIGIGAAILSLLTTSIIPLFSTAILSRYKIVNIMNFIILNSFLVFISVILLIVIVAPILGYKIHQLSAWREDLGRLTKILFFCTEGYSIVFQLLWYKAAIGFEVKQ